MAHTSTGTPTATIFDRDVLLNCAALYRPEKHHQKLTSLWPVDLFLIGGPAAALGILWGDVEEACNQLERNLEIIRLLAPVASSPQSFLTVLCGTSWIPALMSQVCGRDAVATEMFQTCEMDFHHIDGKERKNRKSIVPH